MNKIYPNIIDAKCNHREAFNFELSKDERGKRIGHVVKLTFITNDTKWIADMQVVDPLNPENKIPVVSVLEYICWDGEALITIAGYISPQNRGIFLDALFTAEDQIEIAVEFVIYEYDYFEEKYFQRIHTNKKLIKYQEKEGMYSYVDEQLSPGDMPYNFRFQMCLEAHKSEIDQELYFATTASGKVHKRKLKHI